MALPATPPTPRSVAQGQICDCALLTAGATTQAPGAAIMITVTGTGTVILTLWSGNSITVNPQVGDSIYPFQVKSYTVGTATGVTCYNLFI